MPIGTSNAVLSVLRTHASQLNLWPSSKKYDSKDSKSESKEVVETRGAGDKSSNSSRSEEHTSELQSLMRSTYAVLCFKIQTIHTKNHMTVKDTYSDRKTAI